MIWRRPVSAAQVAEVRAGGLAQRLDDRKAEAHRQFDAPNIHAAQADGARLADDLAAIKRQLEEQAAIIEQLTGRLSGR